VYGSKETTKRTSKEQKIKKEGKKDRREKKEIVMQMHGTSPKIQVHLGRHNVSFENSMKLEFSFKT
jgi:hypothetical protein